jgi:peroxiredoxin
MNGPHSPPSGGRARRGLLAGLAAACVGAGALVAWWRNQPDSRPGGAGLEAFLSASWTDALGQPFDAAGLRGQPLVINFWATWCPPCVEEMPELDQLQRELAPIGVKIIGIGVDSEAKIRLFAEKHRFSYALLPAGAGGAELSRSFGNQSAALPFTVVIARDGRIRRQILGRFRLDDLREAARSAAT